MSSHQCQLQVSEKEQNHGVLDISSMEGANNSHAFTCQKFLYKQSSCNVVVEEPTPSVSLLKLFLPYTSPQTLQNVCAGMVIHSLRHWLPSVHFLCRWTSWISSILKRCHSMFKLWKLVKWWDVLFPFQKQVFLMKVSVAVLPNVQHKLRHMHCL